MTFLGKFMTAIWRDQRAIERTEFVLVIALIVLCSAAAIGLLSGPLIR